MPKNGTPLWREAHLQVKMHKTPRARTNFGRSDVQKWHTAVARSKFVSQNAPNTSARDQFWKVRSGKIARRCGEKCIFESKCAKHHMFGVSLRWIFLFFEILFFPGAPFGPVSRRQLQLTKFYGLMGFFGPI